jgi:ABC-2 type transport system ATP-binding protein
VGIAISMQGVRRSFGAVRALDGVDLEVPEGTVTVILGPNGAGKTTTLRVITGAVARHSGDVRVFGLDPSRHGQAVRHQSGVVPPKPALYDRLSGRDNLNYAARLYELDRPPIDELAERFGIGSVLSQRVAGYSTGMRTRLALVRSLLHAPRLSFSTNPPPASTPSLPRPSGGSCSI